MNRRNFLRNGAIAGATLTTFPALAGIIQDNPRLNNLTTPARGNSGSITSYKYPESCPKSRLFKLKAGNQDIFVYSTSVGEFSSFTSDGPVEIVLETTTPVNNLRIAPKRHGIKSVIEGNTIKFNLTGPVNLLVEAEGMPQLFLYVNPSDRVTPKPSDPGVKYYKAGQIYEAGEIRLTDNETLYIEGGAVVRGCVRATSARNLRIAGQGILDGSYYQEENQKRRAIVLEDCHDSIIEGLILIEPTTWMIVLGICENIIVLNVKELGAVGSTDGLDIVGSSHIKAENCFFRNGDDCIAIKSLDLRGHNKDATLDFTRDVNDIEISGSSFIAYIGGQALEIGHELRTGSISNIRFRNCDILGVHGYGAAFGIHDADRATISNVLYEDIRVEHHYNKLLELRIIKSRWSRDTERGKVKDVIFRNIDVTISEYNPGYSCSIIGGFDPSHTVENVSFENFQLNGKAVLNVDDLDLFCKDETHISFKS